MDIQFMPKLVTTVDAGLQKVILDLIYINSDDRFKYFKYLSADTNHLPAVFVYFGQPKH